VRVIQVGRGLPGARPKHNSQYANHRATNRRSHWLDSFRNEPFSHLFEQAQAFFFFDAPGGGTNSDHSLFEATGADARSAAGRGNGGELRPA